MRKAEETVSLLEDLFNVLSRNLTIQKIRGEVNETLEWITSNIYWCLYEDKKGSDEE